jgi:hypothetical protein
MENNEDINQEDINQEEMSNDELIQEAEAEPKQKTYDVVGLLVGGVFGIFISIVGITDILMGIITGMFIGLVAGTFIKKK